MIITPPYIKKGDTIGVCAPSCSLQASADVIRFHSALDYLNEQGYSTEVTDSVLKDNQKANTSSASVRANEFMSLYLNCNIKAIISATGGELETQILEYLDTDLLKTACPKWFAGYSDNTVLCNYLLTHLGVASLYGYNIGPYGDRPIHDSTVNQFAFLRGVRKQFFGFTHYQEERFDTSVQGNELLGYNISQESKWTYVNGNKTQGVLFGGCLDILAGICGTKFDKSQEFCHKYKENGILFFLETCDLNPLATLRALWQLKNADYFKYASGFIFGRPLITSTYCDYNFTEAVLDVLASTNLPIIFDADLGHKPPTLPFANGLNASIEVIENRGILNYL